MASQPTCSASGRVFCSPTCPWPGGEGHSGLSGEGRGDVCRDGSRSHVYEPHGGRLPCFPGATLSPARDAERSLWSTRVKGSSSDPVTSCGSEVSARGPLSRSCSGRASTRQRSPQESCPADPAGRCGRAPPRSCTLARLAPSATSPPQGSLFEGK